MEITVTIMTILQSFGISLGVGASTIAIVNFFVAIADGKIEETERNLMGVTYVILRVAMVAILFTTLYIGVAQNALVGSGYFTPFVIALWLIITTLYANAILMTLHIMPSTFGPAIQAGSWYTLGMLSALRAVDLTSFSILQFIIGYACAIALAVAIVNGTMAHLKERKRQKHEVSE